MAAMASAKRFTTRIDALITQFIDANEKHSRSPFILVARLAADIDAKEALNSATLHLPKVEIPFPVVNGANATEFIGLAKIESLDANVFLFLAAGGKTPKKAIGEYESLARLSGQLYQELPSEVFPQCLTRSPRNQWAAQTYGFAVGLDRVQYGPNFTSFVPQPFSVSAELWKELRTRISLRKSFVHTENFETVTVKGITYHFTNSQRAVVEMECFIRSGTNPGQAFETVSSSGNGNRGCLSPRFADLRRCRADDIFRRRSAKHSCGSPA